MFRKVIYLQSSRESRLDAPRESISTRLAVERTRAAYDRMMMSWIRTAAGLIILGFTIYKFFQIENHPESESHRLIGPTEFSIALIGIGLISLLLAALEKRRNMAQLRKHEPGIPRSMANALAAVIAVFGIAALIVVLLRS